MAQNVLRLVEGNSVDKQKALDAALGQIERAFGKGSIMKLGEQPVVETEVISTGSLGLDIGLGIGGLNGFRIAHMGHVNAPMMLGTLGSIELALAKLGIPHGAGGVSAAVTSLANGLD